MPFDCPELSTPGPELTDELEKVAVRVLTGVFGDNGSKLILCLHIVDADSDLLAHLLGRSTAKPCG